MHKYIFIYNGFWKKRLLYIEEDIHFALDKLWICLNTFKT